jgi:hypothetical protein
MTFRNLTSGSRLVLAVGALLTAGLFSIMFGYVCDRVFGREVWSAFVLDNFGLVLGLPMAAALAFGIVATFQHTSEGPLAMKLGPLEITGPAGPILLWVVCLLAIVLSIRMLSP